MRGYYKVLGLNVDSTVEEIKTAYRKLAKNYHPDRNPEDSWAERRFKEVNEAYETLGDGDRRSAYDAELQSDLAEDDASYGPNDNYGATGGRSGQPPPFWWRPGHSNDDPDAGLQVNFPMVSAATALFVVFVLACLLLIAPRENDSTQPTYEEARLGRLIEKKEAPPVARDSRREPPSEASGIVRDIPDLASLRSVIARNSGLGEAKAAEEKLRVAIRETEEVATLGSFLTAEERGPFADLARNRIEELRALRTRTADKDAWSAVSADGSIEALIGFLAAHSGSLHADDARKRLGALGMVEVAVGTGGDEKNRWLRAGPDQFDRFQDCSLCPALVVIPTESAGNDPARSKRLAAGLLEVESREWKECVREGACGSRGTGAASSRRARHAVLGVSWSDANDYVRWISRKTGKSYRLLNEAEWRRSFRHRSITARRRPELSTGNAVEMEPDADPIAPTSDEPFVAAVQDAPTHEGLFEWVADCWISGDGSSPVERSASPSATGRTCPERVLLASPDGAKPTAPGSDRFGDDPDSRDRAYTFRVARDL